MPDAALRSPLAPPPPEPMRRAHRRERFRADVLEGLFATPRFLPSVYFYDAWGSRLFQRIMALPEYYPTRCEREILEGHAGAIVASLGGGPATVVDLGAGDGDKTRVLLSRLAGSRRLAYAPVDVSPDALREATARVRREWPAVALVPVEGEYGEGMRWLRAREGSGTFLVLFLGGNIGNLETEQAIAYLRELRRALRPGDKVLVGIDLVKDPLLLQRAYDDPGGVTAAFNLNLLARMNRELGADFDLDGFQHRATFDPGRPAMESWLVSRRQQAATVAGQRFVFQAGEAIHTEISCKYRERDLAHLAREAGFAEVGRFLDSRRWFADVLWRVNGSRR